MQEVREQNGEFELTTVQVGVDAYGQPIYQQQKHFTAVTTNLNAGLVSEHAKESSKIENRLPENVVCFACKNSMMTVTEYQLSFCQYAVGCLLLPCAPCICMTEEYKDVLHKCSLCGTELKVIKY